MKRQMVSAACGIWIALAGAGGAQTNAGQGTPKVVVELYTSQGCSSCPPADAFMEKLAADPSVIALALHVDYWDYIGWKDSFAHAAFTERQKAYARAARSRTIYTPQMIVGGVDRVEGNAPMEVADLVRRHLAVDPPVKLSLTRNGDRVVIRAEADPPLSKMARVQLVRYLPSAVVSIERGENAGKTVTYHNIVTSWEVVTDWTGQSDLVFEAGAAGSEPVVVIIQSAGPSEILAAARLD